LSARSLVQKWILVLGFLLGVPAAIIWASMPFLDMSHATYLTATKDYPGAIKALNRAISFNGGLSAAYVKRGYVWEKMKNPQRALADYDAASLVNPNDWAAFNNKAWLLLNQKELARALTDANVAVNLCESCPEAWDTRGLVYFLSGNYDTALADFNRAIALESDFGAALFHRARTHEAMKQPQLAAADYNAAKEFGYLGGGELQVGQNENKP